MQSGLQLLPSQDLQPCVRNCCYSIPWGESEHSGSVTSGVLLLRVRCCCSTARQPDSAAGAFSDCWHSSTSVGVNTKHAEMYFKIFQNNFTTEPTDSKKVVLDTPQQKLYSKTICICIVKFSTLVNSDIPLPEYILSSAKHFDFQSEKKKREKSAEMVMNCKSQLEF